MEKSHRYLSLVRRAASSSLTQLCFCLLLLCSVASGQLDQASMTGVVEDGSGAIVVNATVILTNVDTGLVQQTRTSKSGVYNFSPIKIGNYSVSASAPGFSRTVQDNVHVDVQDRRAVKLTLKAGSVTETVEVTAAPLLLQTEEASVGQVFSSKMIEDTPLNGRNYLYAAQLTSGVVSAGGSRAAGEGAFSSNGSKAVLNNFVLDGVDNNVSSVDFLSGAPAAVRPPPEAISEFKVQTSDYSAEFGHSSGSVINASVKSGTNDIHGDIWEYVRNNAFDARDYFNPATCPAAGCIPGANAGPAAELRENEFGAALGFPIIKNKLFFFGDVEESRIVQGTANSIDTVPTALERSGNFTELLDPKLTGSTVDTLYEPGSGGTAALGSACGNAPNVMCPAEINSTAQAILKAYPLPNTNLVNGTYPLYNNYAFSQTQHNNTLHWDARVDYNYSARDQAFLRYSNSNNDYSWNTPLGVLDGSSFSSPPYARNVSQNVAVSETHIFNPSIVNEIRYAFNYTHFLVLQLNANSNVAASLGLGGIPSGPGNGGLPSISIGGNNGLSNPGSPGYLPADEHQNNWQLLDNVTINKGRHSLKMGVSLQSIRFSTVEPPDSRGYYQYDGTFTGIPQDPSGLTSGAGIADFLADYQVGASLSNISTTHDFRWDNAFFIQDDWKLLPHLTVNLGVRWELQTPIGEVGGRQAALKPDLSTIKCVTDPNNSGVCDGSGAATYVVPSQTPVSSLDPAFIAYLASFPSPVKAVNTDNRYLINYSKHDFAPRIGFAYQAASRLVARAGFGLYYGALESVGFGGPNMAFNYPFTAQANFGYNPCNNGVGNCTATTGITLKNGFPGSDLGAGFLAAAAGQNPELNGTGDQITPYVMQTNFTLEYALTHNTSFSVGYVGAMSRHTNDFAIYNSRDAAMDLQAQNSYLARPFGPRFTDLDFYQSYGGIGNFHSLQTKIERQFSNGLHFLGTYTWSHALDDTAGNGIEGGKNATNALVCPVRLCDYASSIYDVRHRATFLGGYDLPFGNKQKFLNHGSLMNVVVGGWSVGGTFIAQSGDPLTVGQAVGTIQGSNALAVKVGDPYKGGGSIIPSNGGLSRGNDQALSACPAQVKTLEHWYNTCAFVNNVYYTSADPNCVGDNDCLPPLTSFEAVRPYLGDRPQQINGPGFNRVDASVFKHFAMPWKESQTLTFRVDAFNALNHPAFGDPSTGISDSSGQITNTKTFQNFTVDSRAFQFSLKYSF